MGFKVLSLIGGSYVYGKEVVGLHALTAMKNSGFEIINVCNKWNDGALISKLKEDNIRYCELKLGWFYITKPAWTLDTVIHLPAALWHFRSIVKMFKPDMVYADSYRQIILLYFFLRRQSVVFHVHEENSDTKSGRTFVRTIIPKVYKFIAVSDFIKKDLIKCGVPEEKIQVIYNPVQTDGIVNNKVYMPAGILRMAIVGQILETKGHEDLIAAIIMLKGSVAIHLDIVGTGNEDYISFLKQKINKGDVQQFITWRGFVKDKASIYENVDVVIVPSRKDESFGLVAAEAGAFGCAVIAADSGGLNEIIVDAETGFIVPKRNPEAIAGRLKYLYNKELLARFGMAAGKYVRSRFNMNKFEEEIISTFTKIKDAEKSDVG